MFNKSYTLKIYVDTEGVNTEVRIRECADVHTSGHGPAWINTLVPIDENRVVARRIYAEIADHSLVHELLRQGVTKGHVLDAEVAGAEESEVRVVPAAKGRTTALSLGTVDDHREFGVNIVFCPGIVPEFS